MVPITHEQTIICSETRLDGTTHEQTIICRQLFAGHVVGCRPMEGKKKLHRMIINFILQVFGPELRRDPHKYNLKILNETEQVL